MARFRSFRSGRRTRRLRRARRVVRRRSKSTTRVYRSRSSSRRYAKSFKRSKIYRRSRRFSRRRSVKRLKADLVRAKPVYTMMISQAYLYLATGTVGWNPSNFFNTKPGADPVDDPFNFALILRPF